MLKKFAVIIAICALLCWVLLSNSKEDGEESSQKLTEQAKEVSPVSVSRTSSPTPLSQVESEEGAVAIASLADVSAVSSDEEATIIFQRLFVELFSELEALQGETDADRIISRLNPVAQKFYYLRRAAEIERPNQRLPSTFEADVNRLISLWSDNHELASAADRLFSRFGLLQYEHVPFQFREELVSQ